jgi:adenosylcobyric acid synthase
VAGVDGSAHALGLLPVTTRFEREKLTSRAVVRFSELPKPWSTLSRIEYDGYEIRHGRFEPAVEVIARGSVLGVAAHGAFESRRVLEALFGRVPERSLDTVFDELADSVEAHLDTEQILALAGVE